MTEPFDWTTIPEDQIERIARLDPEAIVREILSRDPKASGGDLRAALAECGHDVSKAQCQRWREAWRAGLAPGKASETKARAKGPDPIAEASNRLTEALSVGDANRAAQWSRVIQGLAQTPVGPTEEAADWSRLTGIEVDVLHYLVSKAYAATPIDGEQVLEWDRIKNALAQVADWPGPG